MTRRPLIAGNWKMNGLKAQLAEFEAVSAAVGRGDGAECDLLLCPPATLIAAARSVLPAQVFVGAQDCHAAPSGAHTGDVSAEMLRDAGATHVILGHSERRADHREDDALVRAKAAAARRAGLVAVVCVGETEAQREAGETLAILGTQLEGSLPDETDAAHVVVAYEPVWAIGTGKTPTAGNIAEVHAFLRAELSRRFGSGVADGLRLLYGGSVKPGNAAELLAIENVDGALVGGASLKASDFMAIGKAARVQ